MLSIMVENRIQLLGGVVVFNYDSHYGNSCLHFQHPFTKIAAPN